MPGSNCSIVGCNSNRKNCTLAIFKVPSGDNEFNKKWRNELVNVVTKDRVMDEGLRRQIENCNVRICEKHFSPSQLNYYDNKTVMKPGVIPTLNLPGKSIQSEKKEERKSSISIVQKRSLLPEPVKPPSVYYKSFDEFKERIRKLKLNNWQIKEEDAFLCISYTDETHIMPKYEIYTALNLTYTLRVFGWKIPCTHEIYENFQTSFENVTLSQLIKKIEEQTFCCGILKPELVDVNCFQKHCIPKRFNPLEVCASPLSQTVIYRALGCTIFTEHQQQCKPCLTLEGKEIKSLKRKRDNLQVPAKLNAPISQTSSERIKATLQSHRLENKQLKAQIEEMKKELIRLSMEVESNDWGKIMSQASEEVSPFMKLFWNEQQYYLKSSRNCIRYHPMVITFCLGLAAKSASAYDELRYDEQNKSGILILPSRRTLQKYKTTSNPPCDSSMNLDNIAL